MKQCFSAYLRLKDAVFTGNPPYDPAALETFLREMFGDNVKMSECPPTPRIAVTSLRVDCWPTQLHLFRNYSPPLPSQRQLDEAEGLCWTGLSVLHFSFASLSVYNLLLTTIFSAYHKNRACIVWDN